MIQLFSAALATATGWAAGRARVVAIYRAAADTQVPGSAAALAGLPKPAPDLNDDDGPYALRRALPGQTTCAGITGAYW